MNIVFLIIIIVSIIVIAVVIFRKFSVLANLDLENLAEEQEVQKKKKLLSHRLMEKEKEAGKSFTAKIEPFRKIWYFLQTKFRLYVGKIERLLHYEELIKNRVKEKQMTNNERANKFNEMIFQAQNQLAEGKYETAEEFFIAAIKLDKKSAVAYRGLGDTYMAKGAVEEAMQTYDFLSKLTPDDDALLVKLSELSEERGFLDDAIGYLERAITVNDSLSTRFFRLAELYAKNGHSDLALDAVGQAVELEPKNPKYLDLLIETAIICGNQKIAQKNFDELRMVNPENNKLIELKEKIDKIAKTT
jgi:tetratricopeptide (TPR) repeat protein